MNRRTKKEQSNAGIDIKPFASCCSRKRCGGERCREVRITELNASEPLDEVSLIMIQAMSKVSV